MSTTTVIVRGYGVDFTIPIPEGYTPEEIMVRVANRSDPPVVEEFTLTETGVEANGVPICDAGAPAIVDTSALREKHFIPELE